MSLVDPKRLKAFGPWVLVREVSPPEKSRGGIYRPQGNLEDRLGLRMGLVESVGQGRLNKGKNAKSKWTPHEVKIGDTILFRGVLHDVGKYHLGIDGLKHSLVAYPDILGIVEDPNAMGV